TLMGSPRTSRENRPHREYYGIPTILENPQLMSVNYDHENIHDIILKSKIIALVQDMDIQGKHRDNIITLLEAIRIMKMVVNKETINGHNQNSIWLIPIL
ncbi:unnamed protein product, partial [Dovyalis caffra]